jgi:hypothetical protein
MFYCNVSRILRSPLILLLNLRDRYGLPTAFASNFSKTSYAKKFIFNIRGHDFLSHCGKWTSSKGKYGFLETSSTSILELALLGPLRDENERNGYDGSEMIISFGPQASSFFADIVAPGLKRYKPSNLPEGLDEEVQKNRDAKGYGNIYEVMMNAVGGWVILFGEGESFEFGGTLPEKLKNVLAEAKITKKASIFCRNINSIYVRLSLVEFVTCVFAVCRLVTSCSVSISTPES